METRPFDPAAYLDNKEAITANLAGARTLYGAGRATSEAAFDHRQSGVAGTPHARFRRDT